MHRFTIALSLPRTSAVLICVAAMLAGCRHSPGGTAIPSSAAQNPSDSPAPNPADVLFMHGMIPHHAQALLIAGWAESHGASPEIRRLAERIGVSQRDEIALARSWLNAHGIDAPDADSEYAAAMTHAADDHVMPGMLSSGELEQLDAASGAQFDRLFLQLMIRHHEGARAMVDRLFAARGAAQDDAVFRFASDVFADQTAEIDRMQRMLDASAGSS